VLNCVDVLAGDDTFVTLRKRRLKHRTLEALEAQTRIYVERSEEEEKVADAEAKRQRDKAQQRLDEAVQKVRESKDYDERTKAIMLDSLEEVENRRLDVTKANIEDERRRKTLDSEARKERAIQRIENGVRLRAVLFPPLPALLLGCLVFGVRTARENRGADPNRLA
jgi:ABC-2 type transport system permease protein